MLVALLQFLRQRQAHIIVGRLAAFRGDNGRFNRMTRHCFQNLTGHCPIHADSTSANADLATSGVHVAAALVAVGMPCCRAIEDTHHAAAPTATHQAGQQSATTTCGFAIGSLLHVSVFADHPLVLLELFHGDVTLMVFRQVNTPVGHGHRAHILTHLTLRGIGAQAGGWLVLR